MEHKQEQNRPACACRAAAQETNTPREEGNGKHDKRVTFFIPYSNMQGGFQLFTFGIVWPNEKKRQGEERRYHDTHIHTPGRC